jgi:hypothetical protein
MSWPELISTKKLSETASLNSLIVDSSAFFLFDLKNFSLKIFLNI